MRMVWFALLASSLTVGCAFQPAEGTEGSGDEPSAAAPAAGEENGDAGEEPASPPKAHGSKAPLSAGARGGAGTCSDDCLPNPLPWLRNANLPRRQ